MKESRLKEKLTRFLSGEGADLVGYAPVDLWEGTGPVWNAFSPRLVWPSTQTVVVLGMAMPLPIVETTPSAYHMELYRSCNRELDRLAFKAVRYLFNLGVAASFFPRDGFGSIKYLQYKPFAAFDHRSAAYFAGLGTMGWNNSILTARYGPRIRFVSLFLEDPLSPDPVLQEELCVQCRLCIELCPCEALEEPTGTATVIFHREACRQWHEKLTAQRRYPCGICIKVCPVGDDRRVYGAEKRSGVYLHENQALQQGSTDPLYRAWKHTRSWGSE